MRSYLDLIPISARVKRKQSRMTIMCIVLAVFLVSGVFSMADMGVRAEKAKLIAKHGNWHVMLQNVDDAAARGILSRGDIAAASWFDSVNYKLDHDYRIGGKLTAVCGTEEAYVTDIRTDEYTGRFPRGADEIMLSANAEELLGIHIGDRITLTAPAGDVEYTVSGLRYDESAVFYDALVALVDKEAFDAFCALTGSQDSYPEYYIRFTAHTNAREAKAEIKAEYTLTGANISENAATMGLEGFSSNSYIIGYYGIAVFLFFLVLTAGVLMISSSMNSNVAQRTQFFGMLRCIGASKRQVRRFVCLEALNWCKIAIPIGIAAAVVMTWGLCALLKCAIGGEFAELPLFAVSPVGIVCGIVIGLVTVLLAAQSPARRASRVSPAAAVSGGVTAAAVRRGIHSNSGKIETVLGVHHAAASKKNLVLMTLSFAVSIVMFLGFSSMLGFIAHAMPSLRGYTPDVSITSGDGSCAVSRELYDELAGRHGIQDVYGSMFALHTTALSDKTAEVDLISYDSYMFDWSGKNAVISGDISAIQGDSNYAFTIHNKDSVLKKGDRIEINGETLEIAGELSVGIWSDGTATVVCSEETFTRLTGKRDYTILSVKFTEDAEESDVNYVRALAGPHSFIDYREDNRQTRGTYWLFRVLVYGFLAVIALITVFNIMNSISMSVSARLRQYGVMRALGMDNGQLIKMITAEAVTYAALGSVIGLAAGLPLNRAFFEAMVTSHFGEPWAFPAGAVAVIIALVAVSCAAAVYTPSKRIKNMSVVAAIANE